MIPPDPFSSLRPLVTITPACRQRFLDLRPDVAEPLRAKGLFLSGHSHLTPGYEIVRPAPEFHVALFTLSGRATLMESDGSLRELTPGSLTLLPPDRPHRYVVDDRWEIVWFHFRRDTLPKEDAGSGIRYVPAIAPESLARAVDLYLDETARSDPAAKVTASLAAMLIAACLDRELGREDNTGPRRADRILGGLWTRVAASLDDDWTLAQLASEAGFSRQHFIRLTRRRDGVSPMGKLAGMRLDRAAHLLVTTDFKIEYIAGMTGFGDAAGFSRAFKRRFGRPPGFHRRKENLNPTTRS